jgi:hypothetical protein
MHDGGAGDGGSSPLMSEVVSGLDGESIKTLCRVIGDKDRDLIVLK